MKIYALASKPTVKKDIKYLPKGIISRCKTTILSLAENPLPLGVVKLKDYKNTYRIRVGNYRIIYEINNKKRVLTVLKIGHRKDIYRKFN
ncbi:hypothetical protein A3A93_01970 [Candidatus Roizmanbacteria bacterium RIFCSPLOWO2_01_FULL_38_12]|uniref:Uncharacterized protein n=1 Tax=Candidatus Roizmanbacteria bacterium RIFCSPLOWO2_01_FULL_38_12 TaxID=1802061 RepID=A0A1F7IXW4_9BACT|nr:MAG: hypothetical protein A2861_01490 [Candidatus Roizmanbacteria bacterium RIFCSPHIGHO2_01_FULL_38_15]OGK35293.1 MAG: hypothetical protein A3F59_02895 [Candidatus Roizmanbacteria bacterium RIFCSPHIGHO2_12_FULL_38_13]OGK48219.1 MAG: hypothetical protein A3A93_01970 [Candidatus Roizmanbacteria bacterium RIFCSPLOWO2_01_FULL_38_12]